MSCAGAELGNGDVFEWAFRTADLTLPSEATTGGPLAFGVRAHTYRTNAAPQRQISGTALSRCSLNSKEPFSSWLLSSRDRYAQQRRVQ